MPAAGFSHDEQIRLLQEQYGVDAARAATLLDRSNGRQTGSQEPLQRPIVPRATISLPLAFTLPWTALVSENRRFCARRNRIFMTADYKAARAKVKQIVRETIGNRLPLDCPLSLEARVYFPDHRVHDAPNFAGATHNALKQLVYTDDRWLYRATWERAGVDPDRPRAEIVIRPYPAV